MNQATRAATVALALSMGLMHDRSAVAQNALGTGNALDANSSVGGGPINTALPLQDYRANNLIITNNVAAGRGFQGSVGYRAVGDFTGHLGSDDLYSFRADSATSSIDYVNFGRTNDRLSLGQDLGVIEYRRSAYSPTGRTLDEFSTGFKPSRVVTHSGGAKPFALPGAVVDAEMRLDRMMSDVSYYSQFRDDAEAQSVGTVLDAQGNSYIAKTSSLRGIRFEQPALNIQQIGLGTMDLARSLEDMKAGGQVHVGRPFDTNFESIPQSQEAPRLDSRVVPQIETGSDKTAGSDRYAEILRRIAERYAGRTDVKMDIDPNLLKGLDKKYDDLRMQLQSGTIPGAMATPGTVPGTPGTSGIPGTGTSSDFSPDDPLGLRMPGDESSGAAPGSPDGSTTSSPAGTRLPTPPTGLPPGLAPGTATVPGSTPGSTDLSPRSGAGMPNTPAGTVPTLPTLPGGGKPEETPRGLRPDSESDNPHGAGPTGADFRQMGDALRHGQQVERLAGDDASRFNEILSTAEDSMRKGEYFFAERRFSQALRYTPDHPLASVGVGHAQFGAGLYLSASLTLRSLLTHHPEMIDTRYEAGLLPTNARIDSAIATLRKRMAEQRSRIPDRASAAFLLAYIAHQRQDKAMIQEGLDALSELTPDDTLTPLLRQVWLGTPAPAPAPASTPAGEDKPVAPGPAGTGSGGTPDK